jgi:hypothetical protein
VIKDAAKDEVKVEASKRAKTEHVEKERASRWPLLAAVVLVAGAAIAFAAWPKAKGEIEKLEPPVATTQPADSAPLPQTQPPDAAPQQEPPDAAPLQGSAQIVVTPKNPKNPKLPHVDAGTGEKGSASVQVPVPTGVKRKVTLQATPNYSEFTVDGGTTVYTTPDTIELAPGTHTIHFTGNKYGPADKTITIDVGDTDMKKSVPVP